MHFAIFKNGRSGSEGTYCIVGAASTISIFADRPTPSDEMHVTTSGGIIRSRFLRRTAADLFDSRCP